MRCIIVRNRASVALFIIAGASRCTCQVADLAVVGTTATQAVIRYTAPDDRGCSIEVVSLPRASSLGTVNDTNPNIFSGSDRDDRPGSLGAGTRNRTVVVGKRSSELATAGEFKGIRHFSRALEANTPHKFIVKCGAAETAVSFSTSTMVLGNTFPDPWFHDAAAPGDQPFPEALGKSPNSSFIDPLTGMYLKQVSTRGSVVDVLSYPPNNPIISAHNQGVVDAPCDARGPWASPCSAIAQKGWCDGKCKFGEAFASVGNSVAWLVLPVDMTQCFRSEVGLWGGTSYDYGVLLDQVKFTVTGYATSSKNQLDVCLSMNGGASCASQIRAVSLASKPPAREVSIGSADPLIFGTDPWVLDSNPRINRPEWQVHRGIITAHGSTLEYKSGDVFSTYWLNAGNATVWLAQSGPEDAWRFTNYHPSDQAHEYALRTLVDGNHLKISGSPFNGDGDYYYCVHNAAIMVRRHESDSQRVFIQGANLEVVDHDAVTPPASSEWTACLGHKVNGGFFCNFGGLFWVNPQTGDTSWFGSPASGSKTTGADQWNPFGPCPLTGGAWDQTQVAPTWYCVTTDSSGKVILLEATYSGPTDPPEKAQQTQNRGQFNGYPQDSTCRGTHHAYCISFGEGKLVYTNLTPASLKLSLTDQLQAFEPAFEPSLFPNCIGAAVVQRGTVLTTCQSQTQDTPAWIFAVDPGDRDPTHAGALGAHIVGATNTFSGPLVRWRGIHSLGDRGEQPWFAFSTNPYGHFIETTNTEVTAQSGTCASFGVSSPHSCLVVQVEPGEGRMPYEPYLVSPSPPFRGIPGELGAARIGDRARFCAPNGERMTLVARNYGGAHDRDVWQRGEQPRNCHAGKHFIYFEPSVRGAVQWNPGSDPHGEHTLVDTEQTGAHGFWRDGVAAEAQNIGSLNCRNTLFVGYQTRFGNYPELANAPVKNITANPAFAGSCYGIALPNDVQSHPNPAGAYAPQDPATAFDIRPFLGASQAPAFVTVTGQLYRATWPISRDPDNLQNPPDRNYGAELNRKLVSTAASCGPHPLIDVSGPSAVIDYTTSSEYRMCIPRTTGECYAGSIVGEVYVNCPDVVDAKCVGNGVHGGANIGMGNDICVFNGSAPAQMAVQFGLGVNDPSGLATRSLTTAVGRLRMTSGFANARVLPDNSWIIFAGDWLNLNGRDIWMGKLPPWNDTPAAQQINRTSFVPVPIALEVPAQVDVDNAVIEFGYQENGAPRELDCTTRHDPCVAGGNVAHSPFQYKSETFRGTPCAHRCEITIQALPQRVLYYRPVFRNAANDIVSAGATKALPTP